MKIDHMAVYVRDLEAAKAFYEKYFGASSGSQYHNPKTGLRTYFLTFEDGGRLELMTRPELTTKEKEPNACGYIHLAFGVSGRDEVDRLTDRFKNDGYIVASEPRVTGDGYYESCVLDPENNLIEIVG